MLPHNSPPPHHPEPPLQPPPFSWCPESLWTVPCSCTLLHSQAVGCCPSHGCALGRAAHLLGLSGGRPAMVPRQVEAMESELSDLRWSADFWQCLSRLEEQQVLEQVCCMVVVLGSTFRMGAMGGGQGLRPSRIMSSTFLGRVPREERSCASYLWKEGQAGKELHLLSGSHLRRNSFEWWQLQQQFTPTLGEFLAHVPPTKSF